MKTTEMLDKLEIKPHKSYRRLSDGLVIRLGDDNRLKWDSGFKHIGLDDEWEENIPTADEILDFLFSAIVEVEDERDKMSVRDVEERLGFVVLNERAFVLKFMWKFITGEDWDDDNLDISGLLSEESI